MLLEPKVFKNLFPAPTGTRTVPVPSLYCTAVVRENGYEYGTCTVLVPYYSLKESLRLQTLLE